MSKHQADTPPQIARPAAAPGAGSKPQPLPLTRAQWRAMAMEVIG